MRAQRGWRGGRDLAADTLGDLDRLLGAGAAQHDGELLSPVARGRVVGPRGGGETLGHQPQNLVARWALRNHERIAAPIADPARSWQRSDDSVQFAPVHDALDDHRSSVDGFAAESRQCFELQLLERAVDDAPVADSESSPRRSALERFDIQVWWNWRAA